MRKSRYAEEKIIRVLDPVESGQKVKDVICEHCISEQTSYRWKPSFWECVSDASRWSGLWLAFHSQRAWRRP